MCHFPYALFGIPTAVLEKHEATVAITEKGIEDKTKSPMDAEDVLETDSPLALEIIIGQKKYHVVSFFCC